MKSIRTHVRRGLAWLALACSSLPVAAQTSIDTKIDGLPPGLSLKVELVNQRCAGPGTGVLATRALTEQTLVTYELAPQLGGGWQLVQRTRTAYVTQFGLPSFPACGGDAVNVFQLVVIGTDGVRVTQLGGVSSGMTKLYATMEAKTTEMISIVNQNAVPVTPVARGVSLHWVAKHGDKMGFESVVDPTLDFLLPSNFPLPGSLFSHTRLSINRDGAVCVRTGGATTCRAKALGGTLTVGGIAVDVKNTTHSGGATSWRFTLLPAFPTGNMTVRAAANDLDDIEYLVDNAGASLDLLPWKGLSLPVLVTN